MIRDLWYHRRDAPIWLLRKHHGESKFDKFMKPRREAELKSYEKATESALDKTLANVAVMIGICLAGALAPWTSPRTADATNAQLGSYALLLSISTGLLALLGSTTHLTHATESARILLRYQENIIISSAGWREGFNACAISQLIEGEKYGFFSGKSSASGSRLTWSSHLRCMRRVGLSVWVFFFGPAVMLIPHLHRSRPKSDIGTRQSDEKMRLYFTVHNETFLFDSTRGQRFCRVLKRAPVQVAEL